MKATPMNNKLNNINEQQIGQHRGNNRKFNYKVVELQTYSPQFNNHVQKPC